MVKTIDWIEISDKSNSSFDYKRQLDKLKKDLQKLEDSTWNVQIRSELWRLFSEIEHINSQEQYEIFLNEKIKNLENEKIKDLLNILKDAQKEIQKFTQSQKADLEALKKSIAWWDFKWLSTEQLAKISNKWRTVSSSNVLNEINESSRWIWILASIMNFFRNRI